MKLLGLLLGVLFGAAEFALTKAIADRATTGKPPIVPTVVKVASYAAVLLPVFLCAPRDFSVWFGVGAGAGLLLAVPAFLWFARKRGA